MTLPISEDGTIYVGSLWSLGDGGKIHAVNPDGTEKWRKQTANLRADSSPCIGEDGTIYVGSSWEDENTHMWFGYLHAFGSVESNDPPEAPIISGETSGKAGEEYWYGVKAFDPDNNPISFYIDWRDGTTTDWTREYASGETAKIKQTFSKQGNYTIKAKARDTLGEEGDWETLEVTMPKNKTINTPFLKFLEQHPRMFPLLQQLLGLQ